MMNMFIYFQFFHELPTVFVNAEYYAVLYEFSHLNIPTRTSSVRCRWIRGHGFQISTRHPLAVIKTSSCHGLLVGSTKTMRDPSVATGKFQQTSFSEDAALTVVKPA